MRVGNRVVSLLLRSPAHRLLSRSVALIRYTGARTGRTITTPVQYAADGDDIVVFVGRANTKRWWRNFTTPRPLEVLIRGRWRAMLGTAIVGGDNPRAASPALEVYLRRFPKAQTALAGSTPTERARHAVLVRCTPR